MEKINSVLLTLLFLTQIAWAQKTEFEVPEFKKSYNNRNVDIYYHHGSNQIVIDEELRSGIGHLLFDTSFNLISKYEKVFTEKESYYNKMPLKYAKAATYGNGFYEAYVCDTAIGIIKLDFQNGIDSRIAIENIKRPYKDAEIIAIMPSKNDCSFLTYSKKKKKLILYKWKPGNDTFQSAEYALPENSLSIAEQAQYSKLLEMDYKDLLKNLSVSETFANDVFKMPSQSQLFYNDSMLYLVNKTPYSTGINVLSIDKWLGQLNCTNYFLNELDRNALGTIKQKYPTATIFNNDLIIANPSDKVFEYHFYNVTTGTKRRSYAVNVEDSLNMLVHSVYRQLNLTSFGTEEKSIEKNKAFVRRYNNGKQFIKPMLMGDSLVLTFGSAQIGMGAENIALMVITAAAGFGMHIMDGDSQVIPYVVSNRVKFVYAHSKFALKDWTASASSNTTTILDQVIDEKRFKDAGKQNSIIIDMPGRLFLGVYNKQKKKYELIRFYQ